MKRLLDDLGPSARRELLESAEADEPRHPDARARALAAALGVMGTPSATTDTPAPKAPTNHPPPAAPSAGLATPVVKALALATLVIGGVVVVVGRAGHDDGTTKPAPTPSTIASASGPDATEPPVMPSSQLVPATEPSSAAPTSNDGAHPTAPPRLRPSSDAPSGHAREDALTREVRAIGAARAALASGDPSLALRELDEYERIPNAHTLRPEARVLRLEALAKAGRTREAGELGKTLRSNPEMSAYSRRIDAVLEIVAPKEGAP